MENKTNFELWFEEFKKGWQTRVVENEHLLKICFLEFISTINKVRYIYGGQYKTVNLSSFKIQQSGTGKGVGDGYVHDLLRYMGYKVCKINSFTEAAIIGSLHTDMQGKTTIIKGALGDYDFIWIDEGRNLIVGNNWSQGLLEVINGYLDDGWIFKRLAKGEIKYWSNCNFATGTFFFNKLKPAVLATGLFQRSLFSYKYYSKDEIINISKLYDSLATKNYIDDLKPIFERIAGMRNNLNFEKYNISKIKDRPNYVIKMDLEASKKFGKLVDDFFENEIFNQLGDNRLKDILVSFLIRSKQLGHRIMCLEAIWNEKNIIDSSCIPYALEVVKEQLKYILEFISESFEGTKFDSDDLNKEEVKNKKILKTKQAVIRCIKENSGISKGDFRKYVQNNRSQFYCGELRVIREILPDLILEGKIKEESGDKAAEKRLYITI